MTGNGPRYIIICPVRDEEQYLGATITSIVAQSIQPLEFILVDDGSTDATPDIIQKACEGHPWIHGVRRTDRGERKVGPGVVEAFYEGYRAIRAEDYDYICKLDGDLSLGPVYFETLLAQFGRDPYLGAASGKIFFDPGDGRLVEERIADESVFGGVLCLKRACFEAIGGFVHEVMWDGITFHRARMEGYRTWSFRDSRLVIRDYRPIGASQKSIYHGRIRWGWGQYFMGTHPLYILAIGAYRMLEYPYVIGGILIVAGYLKGLIKRTPRYDYPGFRKSLHAWQLERLGIAGRLENIPDAP